LVQLVEEYPKILVVHADNVGSKHLQHIRTALRGKAEILMGKNTRIRKAIKDHLSKNKRLEELLKHVKGNVGFVFTKGDLREIRDLINDLKVEAPAKVDSLAPSDVTIFAGLTGLDPSQTALFQAINIASKINKSQIEILSDHLLLKKGEKIGSSEATLLTKLNIKPFAYALQLRAVYDDGSCYHPDVLDITDEDIQTKFLTGVKNVAALGLALHFPVTAAIPHLLVDAFKNILSIAFETSFTFPIAEKVKTLLASGGAHHGGDGGAHHGGDAAHHGAHQDKPAGGKGADKGKPEQKKPADAPKPKEPEPEPDEEGGDMGLGLFD